MHPLRIVQISTSDLAGGAEKTAWKLHRRFRDRGHASALVVGRKFSNDPDVIEIDNSARGRGIQGRIRSRLEWNVGLQYIDYPGSHQIPTLVGGPWDVTHAHNLHGGYFDLAALPRLSQQAPVILTLHDMWLLTGHCAHSFSCERWRQGCGSCPDLAIYPAVPRDSTRANLRRKRRLLGDLDVAIASPAHWLLELVADSYLHAKPSRYIPNPVDTHVFTPREKAEARSSLDLPLDRQIVLLPARHAFGSRFKDGALFEAAIRALADLRPLGVTFGEIDRPATEELRIVPPSFDETLLARYYGAADVIAVPSRAETLPLTILEGFATARPVVATRVGGVPELVRDGENGLLVEVSDVSGFAAALRLVLESPELAATLGANGLRDARSRHDLDKVADLWLEWYRELAERSRGGEMRNARTAAAAV
jgi:glycosyltransferase involved in cell wall biosynthesis